MNREENEVKIPEIVEVLPVDDIVVFPQIILPFHITFRKHIEMVDRVLNSDDRMLLVVAKSPDTDDDELNFYEIGAASIILKMLKLPDNTTQILVQGIKRVKIEEVYREENLIKARISPFEDIYPEEGDLQAEAY
ncbi:MAG: LON peptidase substrate-binding domain-containing protein, partial [Candidatus Muiribacteriaceae bacterium]